MLGTNLTAQDMQLLSGLLGAGAGYMAQNNATNQATNAMNQSLAQQMQIYNTTRGDFSPYRDLGTDALSRYRGILDGTQSIKETPEYQWEVAQTDKNMNRQLRALGRQNSTYGMNALADAYNNLAVKEKNSYLDRLQGDIKTGSNASAMTGSAGNTLSGAVGTTGLAQAANTNQGGSNSAAFLSGLGSMPMAANNLYTTQNNNNSLLSQLLGRG
jgi:hypothetical protein